MREFTVRAVVTGVALGVVFGAANAFLGLKVGMTVSASIPAAVMTVALLRGRASLLEANLSQTIGSATTSLATGTIFTLPALYLWGLAPPYWQIALLALCGGVFGLAAMIPLRRMLIVDGHDELPYPEGRACAEVLKATTTKSAGSAWIFRGMAIGAGVKGALALLFLVPPEVATAVPILPKAEVALEFAPALLAVGFILGYRQSAVVVAGAVVSSLALIPLIAGIGAGLPEPLYPEREKTIAAMDAGEIWRQYIRYIGAGAVATAGVLTVLRSLPMMGGAFLAVARGMRQRTGEAPVGARTERDLPGGFIVAAVMAVIAAVALVPGLLAGDLGIGARLVCALAVAVFGLLSVAVAARIVGIVGVSSQPTSGITLVTLLGTAAMFAALGWDDPGARAAVLTVGTVVAVATSKAGDISQDLKTGYLVGATPAWQQLGQLIAAACACWAVAATVMLLSNYGFGGKELPAPQATLMKTIIEGVLSGELPWGLVATGAGIAGSAMLCGVSGLAFAIGVYLPLSSMLPIFVGGCVRGLSERGGAAKGGEARSGILAAAGVVAGEGLAGVLVAALVVAEVVPKKAPPVIGGTAGQWATLVLVAAVCAFLYRAARADAGASEVREERAG